MMSCNMVASLTAEEKLSFFSSGKVSFPSKFDIVIPKTPLYEGMVEGIPVGRYS